VRRAGRQFFALLGLALLTCGGARAAEGEGGRRELSLAVTASLLRPFSSTTRDRFGDTWFGIGGDLFNRRRPSKWAFSFDLDIQGNDDVGKATLIPLTFGVIRGLGEKTKAGWQPFVAFRVGPYYGKVEGDRLPIEDETLGFNGNATVGILFRERYALSLRYDYFSRFARTNFDSLSLRAAVRVLDVKL
jgi:hypothetical protein